MLLPQLFKPVNYKPFPVERVVRTPRILPKSSAILGLEFEYENTGIPRPYWERYVEAELIPPDVHADLTKLFKWYNSHVDTSLRGDDSIELVFKRGYTVTTAERAVLELLEIARKRGFSTSKRTGLHVHLNMGEATRDMFRNICSLYSILEPAIYNAAGGERSANPYCVPWFYDGSTTRQVQLIVNGGNTDQYGSRRLKKYSGLNLKPLWNYSTIEFRHLRNTLDQDTIFNWLRLIINLYEFSKRADFEDVFRRLVFEEENYARLIHEIYNGQPVWEALIFPDLAEEINTTPIIVASEIILTTPLYR